MDTFFSKLSSYNLLNYLLPGVLFCFFARKYWGFELLQDASDLEKLFIWYFFGLLISRLGSSYVEKYLRDIKWIEYADYPEYLQACRLDNTINDLSEVNNTYRTMLALGLIILGGSLVNLLYHLDTQATLCSQKELLIDKGKFCVLGFALVYIFYKAYKKQTDYIRKRVHNNLKAKVN